MIKQDLSNILNYLTELLNDQTVPKNIKIKIEGIIKALEENCEVSLKVNRALNDLDEITNDVNIQSYTRTQLWNIASLLEKVNT